MNTVLLNQLLTNIVTTGEFFCLIVDKNNRIVFANKKAETISGYSKTELLGTDYREIMGSASPLQKEIDLSTLSPPFSWQTVSRTKTGINYDIELTVFPVSSVDSENFYAFTGQLNPDQPLLEKIRELRKANQHLTDIVQHENSFITVLSHEFKSPLNTIIGFSNLILEGMTGPITDEQKDFINRVFVAGESLNTLVTDVRDIFKIDAGKFKSEISQVDITELTDELYKSIQRQLNQKQLKYQRSIPSRLSITTDYRRLLQCLMNLLTNAIKYSQQGTIKLSIKEECSYFVFAVTDQGIGISTENKLLVFNPFIKIDSPLRQKAHESGLGLYLTKKLVEDVLGGEIHVESKIKQGSTFYIRLPKTTRY